MKMERRAIFILFFSVFMLGVALRLYNFGNVKERTPDEEIYARQAQVVVEKGTEGIKLLVREYNANEKLWLYPSPIRVGYIWTLASVMKMANSTDVKVGAYISCFFSISSLLFLVLLGLRFFNKWIALYALLFMSVSPMSLAIARRAWQDAMVGFTGLLLVYFCCEITRAGNKIIWYILFILIGSFGMLIKESASVVYVLCTIWLLWILFIKEKSFSKVFFFVVSCGAAAAISVAYLSYACGGLSSILEILRHVREQMPTNTYAVIYQSGPWYYFLQGFWIMSPVNAILCFIGIVWAILFGGLRYIGGISSVDKKKKNAIYGIVFFSIVFMAIAAATPYCQNLRYVSALFAPFYLISGLGLWQLVSVV